MFEATGKGIMPSGSTAPNGSWTIGDQDYRMMALEESSFAYEVICEPGQSVPTHLHVDQDEFILVQFGHLCVTLDGEQIEAGPGDLVRMPRGLPHRYENRSPGTARALFWVSPAQRLAELFAAIDGITDPSEVVRISAEHGIVVRPPET